MSRLKTTKPIMGWREWVRLPELGVASIKAKVDSGARSCALHAFAVEILEGEPPRVKFEVHPFVDDDRGTVTCCLPLHGQRWVRSSNGRAELRPVVRTTMSYGRKTWRIDLTLTSRDAMGFRMLIGREAIRRRFLIDPGRSFRDKAFIPPSKEGTT